MLLKNRYELKNTIGNGGMSVTYSAYDRQVDKDVVVKVTNVEDTASRTKALRECDLLMSLKHKNIVEVYDSVAENNKIYMVMEKINGITLREYTNRYKMDFETVLNVMRAICSVLDYLHSQNPMIIYRDLTPDNVMINPGTKELKLIDFGIARFYKELKHKDTEQLGTPGFAPPEQYGFDQTDGRSDIYSLGATMYYVIARKEPFTYPRVNKSLKDFIPEMGEDMFYKRLSDVIDKCMKPKKADRYENCRQLGRDLEDIYISSLNLPLGPEVDVLSTEEYEAEEDFDEKDVELRQGPDELSTVEDKKIIDKFLGSKLVLGGFLGFFVLIIIIGLLNL